MKQPNFMFFRERELQGDRLGRLLVRSNQISYIEWGWACREENNQSEVYNPGVKRDGVEASGVEQSSCDARV